MPSTLDHAEPKNPGASKELGKGKIREKVPIEWNLFFSCDPKTDVFHKEHLNPAFPGELKWLP